MAELCVAIHQPNYLPWQGYFSKLAHCDIFILLDNVQLERRGRTHRTEILGHQGGAAWISQSLKKRAIEEQNIIDTRYANLHWVRKHLNTLKAVYGKARYFRQVYPALEKAMLVEDDSLVEYNTRLIAAIARSLKIKTRIVRASSLGLGVVQNASDRLARLTRAVGGHIYLSGQGARSYNDESEFRRHGVSLEYLRFVPQRYEQKVPFVPNLSVVDALFHIGPADTARLIGREGETSSEVGDLASLYPSYAWAPP